MAVDSTMFLWFKDLQDKFNIFGNASNILDFGPQGIWNSESWGHSERKAKYLYQQLGIANYDSIDHMDPTATLHGDLNYPLKLSNKFDIVTDFGTMEHCFNIESFLSNMHEATEVNGVMLHVVPTAHGYNHGFYNFNSTLFLDLATANRYEILDIRYVPSHAAQSFISNREFRNKSAKMSVIRSISHLSVLNRQDSLYITLLIMRFKIFFSLRLLPRRLYLRTLFLSGDQLFVALRKINSDRFVIPSQNKYSRNSDSNRYSAFAPGGFKPPASTIPPPGQPTQATRV